MIKDFFIRRLSNWVERFPGFNPEEKREIIEKINCLEKEQVNILLVGGTGVGKSSTINALFDIDGVNNTSVIKAKIGIGPNPETKLIQSYKLNENIVIWDTPGLGESISADILNSREINKLLRKETESGSYLIDLVLVVFDGSSRDYSETLQIVKIALGAIGDKERIIFGINRTDMILQGYGWDYENSRPKEELKPFIEKKINYITNLLKSELNIDSSPTSYCAGRADDGWGKSKSYKIPELFCRIISNIPKNKRIAVIKNVKSEVIERASKKEKQIISNKASESFGAKFITRIGLSFLTGGLFSGCFITSAVCNYLNKGDDCFILKTFRKFRDNWLFHEKDGLELIETYYREAPSIVEWIDSQQNREYIYNNINKDYLLPCYRAIKQQRYDEAKERYIDMVLELENAMKRGN